MVFNRSNTSPCILSYNQTAGWFDLPDDSGGPCHSANATWISGWWPAKGNKGDPPRQPKWAPFCWGMNWGEIWPWTGCQSRTVNWGDKSQNFTFSPGISKEFNASYAGKNFSDQNPFQDYVSNSFDNWLFCGVNGSCMNLEPMVMIAGGLHNVSQFTWSHSRPWGFEGHDSPKLSPSSATEGISGTNTGCSGEGYTSLVNVTYRPTRLYIFSLFIHCKQRRTQLMQE